jgi:hypothetical protein
MAALFLSYLITASFLNFPPEDNTRVPLRFYPDWTPGVVVLETDDTVACTLRYSQLVPEGLLQVADADNILTLSVRDVKSFSFFDAHLNRYRKFFTLSIPLEGRKSREMFLEYIYGNDRVSILNHKTMGLAHSYMEFTPFKQPVPLSKQYLLDRRTGKLMPLSEQNALSLLQKRRKVAKYIRNHDIRFRKLSDYVNIFEYDLSLYKK